MAEDGVLAYDQLLSYIAVAFARCYEAHNLNLPHGQAIGILWALWSR